MLLPSLLTKMEPDLASESSETKVDSPYSSPSQSPKIDKSARHLKMAYEPSFVPPKRVIGDYGFKVKQLGRGTYGVVNMYEGSLGKVAIKTMSYDDGVEGITSSTLREISVMVRMSHPNVVSVLDVMLNIAVRKIHMVMSLARTDLKGFIDSGKHRFMPVKSTPEETDKHFAYQILCGVNYCLTKGIINRDIKPQNILVYEDGTAKIADFGLARASNCSFDTGATREVYTLWYRPPEVLLGAKYSDPADVWAVACTLYELYTSRPLFPGNTETGMIMRFGKEFGKLNVLWPGVVDMPDWRPGYSVNQEGAPLSLMKDMEMKTILLSLLEIDPHRRPYLQQIISASYFDTVRNSAIEDLRVYSCNEILEQRSELPVLSIGLQKFSEKVLFELYDWLAKVSKMFKLQKQSLFLGLTLLEKYMAEKEIADGQLQLFGCASLSVACKVMEVYSPELNDFAYVSDGAFTNTMLDNAETILVSTIGYDLIHTTPVDFLIVYLNSGNYDLNVKRLGQALLHVLAIDKSFRFRYTPEELALGCLFIACTYTGCRFKHTVLLTPKVVEMTKDFENYTFKKGAFAKMDFADDFSNIRLHPSHDFAKVQDIIKEKGTIVL